MSSSLLLERDIQVLPLTIFKACQNVNPHHHLISQHWDLKTNSNPVRINVTIPALLIVSQINLVFNI